MPRDEESRRRFDQWAETYDEGLMRCEDFPLIGYREVLRALDTVADVRTGMRILDLGTGTGNLAGLFLQHGCDVWATDFSPAMLERAKTKFPRVHFGLADLREGPPAPSPRRYDRIVSAYALHHLPLGEKCRLLEELATEHLLPDGFVVLADVAFATSVEREAARSQFADIWDPDEDYWAADETRGALQPLDLTVDFFPVSWCGGLFRIGKASALASGGTS